MITTASLKAYSQKDLAQLAKKRGIDGWHSMKKDQLIRALGQMLKVKSATSRKSPRPAAKTSASSSETRSRISKLVRQPSSNGHSLAKKSPKPKHPSVLRRLQKAQEQRETQHDLAQTNGHAVDRNGKGKNGAPARDRVVLLVRDPYWLQAYWEVNRQSVQRAQAALAEQWHSSYPVLRLVQVESNGTTSTAERVIRDIRIHGGVRNWYIDIQNQQKSYRVDLGYLAGNGKFHTLARSNSVTPPRPGSSEAIDDNWTDVVEDYEKIYAQSGGYAEEQHSSELQELFEERLRRPMKNTNATGFGIGAEGVLKRKRSFQFEVDAEMIVYGTTKSDAHVMLGGEPVKISSDGTFRVRVEMPDKRQVIPVVASSKDGVEQRTIVLAIERNTKVMEPVVKESSEDDE